MSEVNYNPAETGGTAGKTKGGKKLITVVAVVAAVAVMVSVAAGILLSNPMSLVARGAANSAKAVRKSDMVKLLDDVAAGGSMEYVLGLEELTEQAYGTGIDGSISLKLYGNKDPRFAAMLGLKLGGKTFADASIFASEESLILTSDVLLEGDAYGINLKNAADNFENSIFGPDGYLSIGLDNIDMLVDLIEMNEEMTAKLEELTTELTGVALDSLKEHGEISKENDKLKFAGESVKVTAVEIVLDDDAIEDVIRDVLDYLRDSEKFEEYMELDAEYSVATQKISALAEYMENQYYYEYYYDISSFDEYFEYFYGDTEMDVEEVYEALDEIEDELEYMEIEELTLVCYISKAHTQLIGCELEIEVYDETMRYTLVAGPELNNITELRFVVDQGYDTAELVYEVETNDKSEYVATLCVEEFGDVILSGEIEWDKKDGDLDIALVDEYGDEIKLSGEFLMDAKSAEFKLERITAEGETVDLNLTVTLNASDKMPDAPEEYEEILELDSADIEELAANVSARLMEAYYDLDGSIQEMLQGMFW